MKKSFLFLATTCAALWMACSSNDQDSTNMAKPDTDFIGSTVFAQYCVTCHGADGKLGLNGAKHLNLSVLSVDERVALITHGKGAMTAFSGILKPDEIRAVANYTLSFK
jgi:cytochrome c6